jgi:hypothetical protein
VYFCSAVDDLLGVVLYWHLDLEFADMTKDEALKLALEALEHARYGGYDKQELNKAITAIKEALAQPEERNFCQRCGKRTADLTTIHTCTPPLQPTIREW